MNKEIELYELYEDEEGEPSDWEGDEDFYFCPDEPIKEITNASMVCSVKFAEWMKKKYFAEVSEPSDNMDMILRYCDAWNEAFFEEENRKANELYYPVKVEDGQVSMTVSYPLTRLEAKKPVDLQHTPALTDFIDGYAVLTTCAAFPGLQQSRCGYGNWWSMDYIVNEAKYNADRYWERLSGEELEKAKCRELCEVTAFYEPLCDIDCFSRGEFYRALDEGFVDNEPLFSFGPACPDRLLSDSAWSNILRHMLCDFYKICSEKGIQREYKEIFCTALCVAWIDYLHKKGINQALEISIPFDVLINAADILYEDFLLKENNPEDSALKVYLFMLSRVRREIAPFDEEKESHYVKSRGAALRNRDNALRPYISPREKYGF